MVLKKAIYLYLRGVGLRHISNTLYRGVVEFRLMKIFIHQEEPVATKNKLN